MRRVVLWIVLPVAAIGALSFDVLLAEPTTTAPASGFAVAASRPASQPATQPAVAASQPAGPSAVATSQPASRPAGWASAPSLDSCRIVGVLPPETKGVPIGPGQVAIAREHWIFHDDARKRRRTEPLPPGVIRPGLQPHPYGEVDYLGTFQGVGADGRAWFTHLDHSGRKLTVQAIGKDKATSSRVSYDGRMGEWGVVDGAAPHWPWKGKGMLGDPDGSVWLLTLQSLVRLPAKPDQEKKQYAIPVPDDPKHAKDLVGSETSSPYFNHHMYRFGDEIWVIRQYESNCSEKAACVLRFAEGRGTLMARLPKKVLTGLVQHKGAIYLMLGQPYYPDGGGGQQIRHLGILRMVPRGSTKMTLVEIRKAIEDLDAEEWETRDAAARALANLPAKQVGVLREALEAGGSPERKRQLETAIEAVESDEPHLEDATLGGADRLSPLYIDGQGVQYLQPWSSDGPLEKLLIVGPKELRTVALPSKDGVSVCQGDDRRIYVSDDDAIHVLDPKTGRLHTVATLGPSGDRPWRLLGVRGRVAIIGGWQEGSSDLLLCVDLSAPASVAMLPGKEISAGLPVSGNRKNAYPVAVGPKGRLWFLRVGQVGMAPRRPGSSSKRRVWHTQICRAQGGRVTELSDPIETCDTPSVWPIGPDTAIVPTEWGSENLAIWYHDGKAKSVSGNLLEIVEAHHETILATMSEGDAFLANDYYERAMLFRLGDSLYAQDGIDKRYSNGGGLQNRCGIWSGGRWVERREEPMGSSRGSYDPIFCRTVALDPETQRVLAYTDKWCKLQWVSVPGIAETEEVASQKEAWAWQWINQTPRPRFEGSWTLTPDGGKTWRANRNKRIADMKKRGKEPAPFVPHHSADFPAFWRFAGERWLVLNHSVYGAAVWDTPGAVWQFRTGEVLVTDAAGDQLIPLPGGGGPEDYRLAIESESAVWIASMTDLTRFVQTRAPNGGARWEASVRFRLPNCGAAFSGPWISGGNMYYVSNGSLFHARMKDLLAQPAKE